MSNLDMVIYEMCDLRDVIREVTGGVEDLSNFTFKSKEDEQKVTTIAKSVMSGGKVSLGNRLSFVSYFVSQCRLVPTYSLQAPMACNATTTGLSTKMNIFFNPIRMAYMNAKQRDDMIFMDSFETVGNTILHEAFHLLYNHHEQFDHFIQQGYMEQVNIGTDAQINQDPVIMADKTLMDYGITLEAVRKYANDPNLEPRRSSHYYFEALMKNRNGQGQGQGNGQGQGSGQGQGNGQGQNQQGNGQQGQSQQNNKQQAINDAKHSHSVWKQNPDDVNAEKYGGVADSNSARQAVMEGVEQAMKNGNFDAEGIKNRGLVAGDILDSILSGGSRDTKLPIKHFIQRGIGRIKHGVRRTYSKMNKHQSNNVRVLRGKKVLTAKNIHVFYDTSGSVSQKEIDWTFNEVGGLAYAAKADLWAIPFDAQVYPEAKSKVDRYGRYNANPKGRGGTAFQPIFDYLYEHQRDALRNQDLIIVFTDGYGEGTVDTKGFHNIVWILVGQNRDTLSVQDPIGSVAYLENDQYYQVHKMSSLR